MGGIWGLAAATALENLPAEARGLASGVLQQGYAVGYLIAAVINLYLVPHTSWRALFWTAAGISAFAAFIRVLTPESAFFLQAHDAERMRIANGGQVRTNKTRVFLHETKEMLKKHWKLCIYAVLLMTGQSSRSSRKDVMVTFPAPGFNFLSHGSQDLYPTYMTKSKGFSSHDATVATIIGNCGAIAGGTIAGFGSQYIGRRLAIMYVLPHLAFARRANQLGSICICLIAAFIPLWILPSSFSALSAGGKRCILLLMVRHSRVPPAFCIQFGVQGAWGVIPVFLAEISPPAFRATFPGVAYQLGNMISAASAQIEATGGDHLKTTIIVKGKPTVVPDYAKVQGILIGVVAAYVFVLTVLGPEKHGSQFEKYKAAFEEGGGNDEVEDAGAATHVKEPGSPRGSLRVEDEKRDTV
jgi:SHS family lactate transporter-like MFS transporter